MKAFFITLQITHYRVSFYEKLINANPEFEWLIIDGEKKKKDTGRPSLYKQFNFPTKRFTESIKHFGPYATRNYPGLLEFIKKENPVLIIMPTIVGTRTYRQIARWCKTNNKKLILWSCLWENEAAGASLLKYLKKVTFKRFVHQASNHITYSSFASKKLIRNGINPELIQIAYNGIDLEDLEKFALNEIDIKSKKNELNISSNKTLLYVGAINKEKKVDLLLRAFSLFKSKNPSNNARLIIIGDGIEKHSLERLCDELGIGDRTKFLGRIVENVDAYFQLADCFVLPGAGGLGLNQAMYWNKPCIVSHADGTEEDLIIDGKTGFRFENSSVESLEIAIERFYTSATDRLNKMGIEAKKIVQNQSNVNEMIRVFTSVIKSMKLND